MNLLSAARLFSVKSNIACSSTEIQLGKALAGSLAVYDSVNERIKVYDAQPSHFIGWNACGILPKLAGKLIAYARPGERLSWLELGFSHEGTIRGYFRDGSDAHLWAGYLRASRREPSEIELSERALTVARSKSRSQKFVPNLGMGYSSERATEAEAGEIAQLLRDTFSEYPNPLEAEVIARQIRQKDNCFRTIRDGQGQLAAVASAEMDHQRLSAEMTDCATRVEHRGRGLMANLLWLLEQDVRQDFKIRDVYTLARAVEVGMNCAFGKLGYSYCGRLINNCRMPLGWESMNIWSKRLSDSSRGC